MSDVPAAKSRPGLLRWALLGAVLFGVAAVLYIIAQALSKPSSGGAVADLAKGEMAKLTVIADAGPAPAASFVDAAGEPVRLADFKGKVVVANLWATWCAPCIEEMPTLAALAKAYEGRPVEVVAISVDRPADVEKARAFLAKHAPLEFYNDPKMGLPFALSPPAAGMPTTVIYGPDGLERGRLAGSADWSSPEARRVVDAVLASD